MKHFALILSAIVMLTLGACSDDMPAPKQNDALYGIYSRGADEFMEIDDLDWIYQYNLEDFDGEQYWVKRKLTYLYEPVSELMLREDTDGLLQVDKVISVTDKDMVLCWVGTPMTDGADSDDAKFEIIQIFFKNDYKPDPANYRTYTRITAADLKAGLGSIEVIEAY